MSAPSIAVVMGVAGSGKTTVALLLAEALGAAFQEGDDLHPPQNVEKMRAGTPLSDADRLPWLASIAAVIDGWRARGQAGVVACSALKRSYRDLLIGARREVRLVYLRGSPELIRRRMALRQHHYMPLGLLDSQFATLEEPMPDEHAIVVEIEGGPQQIAARVLQRLQEKRPGAGS